MVTFPEVPLGILLFCVCVITIGAVQVGYPGLPSPPHIRVLRGTGARVGCGLVAAGRAVQTELIVERLSWAAAENPEGLGSQAPVPVAERVQRGHPGFLAGRGGAETHPSLPRSVAGLLSPLHP